MFSSNSRRRTSEGRSGSATSATLGRFGALGIPTPGEVAQGVVREPEDGPLVQWDGAGGLVELDGRRVPVQHRPLQPVVPVLHAGLGERAQQLLAQAAPAVLRLDVEVLEVDAVGA